jgi:hypothetical protein
MLIDIFYQVVGAGFPLPDAVINISNVAAYVYNTSSMTTLPELADAISLRRPFPITWFEFLYNGYRMGILSQERGTQDGLIECEDIFLVKTAGRDDFILCGREVFLYDSLGKWHSGARNQRVLAGNQGPNTPPSAQEQLNIFDRAITQGTGILCVALNFLHCKNVELVENRLLAMEVKARKKENKDYYEKFYTLKIGGIRKILDTEGEAQTKGLKHALHVCRGYFRTTNLFGKYPGTYWIPAHTRGDEEIGKIHKDYRIEPQ